MDRGTPIKPHARLSLPTFPWSSRWSWVRLQSEDREADRPDDSTERAGESG